MSLLIIGCTTVDFIFPSVERLPAWPSHTEFTMKNLTFLPKPPIITLGGNGANAALVAARRGATVTLYTAIGGDPLGQQAYRWLYEAGCQILPNESPTPVNITAANSRQQRATFFYPGKPLRLPARRAFAGASHVLVCGWPHPPADELGTTLPALRKKGIFTALDAGPILGKCWTRPELRRILHGLDLFIANEHEIGTLTGTRDAAEAIRRVRRDFAGHIVIKRGAEGALWAQPEAAEFTPITAPKVRVVNTVGAGDSFNGALLGDLAQGMPFARSLRAACATASAVVASGRGVLGAPRRRTKR